MHLLQQPGVAASLITDPLLTDQGLLARVLPAAPASTAGTRFWREPREQDDRDLAQYNARLTDVLALPLPLRPGTTNELAPRVLTLSGDARALWIAFADHIEKQLGPDGPFAPIRAFAAKAAEHAARLAAILALIDDLTAPTVTAAFLEAGITLVEHDLGEWLRLHDVADADPALLRAKRLLQWLATGWTEPLIGLPEIYQLGPNALRDARTAREAVQTLADHGWLVPQEGGAVVGGRFIAKCGSSRRRYGMGSFERFPRRPSGAPPRSRNALRRTHGLALRPTALASLAALASGTAPTTTRRRRTPALLRSHPRPSPRTRSWLRSCPTCWHTSARGSGPVCAAGTIAGCGRWSPGMSRSPSPAVERSTFAGTCPRRSPRSRIAMWT